MGITDLPVSSPSGGPMYLKHLAKTVVLFCLAIPTCAVFAQSPFSSLAEYKKKQDEGIAQAIQDSQQKAASGKLAMGKAGKNKRAPQTPAVIRMAHPPRQTGIDNRRALNVR